MIDHSGVCCHGWHGVLGKEQQKTADLRRKVGSVGVSRQPQWLGLSPGAGGMDKRVLHLANEIDALLY